jgi:hypothetical protein
MLVLTLDAWTPATMRTILLQEPTTSEVSHPAGCSICEQSSVRGCARGQSSETIKTTNSLQPVVTRIMRSVTTLQSRTELLLVSSSFTRAHGSKRRRYVRAHPSPSRVSTPAPAGT